MNYKYDAFSYVYNSMNYDIPYNLWLDIIEPYNKGSSILDIGAGTGEILKNLNATRKVGIDNSESMVEIATENDGSSEYIVSDMKSFNFNETFDLIIATVDVLNYVKDIEDFKCVLSRIYDHLSDDGICIFDIHSAHKIQSLINGETYTDESEDFVYIWNTFMHDEWSLYHELTFFIKETDDLYKRYFETHFQRTFPHETVLNTLENLNFNVVNTFSDFDPDGEIRELSERTFYIIKK